jgi:Segregation and condensation complex subunit ScpB
MRGGGPNGSTPDNGCRTGCWLEHADQLEQVTVPDGGQALHVDPPEALSQAALEVLAIVTYEQPVSRADIGHIRGTDTAGDVDTLLAHDLMADEARFGGRGPTGVPGHHRSLSAGRALARLPSCQPWRMTIEPEHLPAVAGPALDSLVRLRCAGWMSTSSR